MTKKPQGEEVGFKLEIKDARRYGASLKRKKKRNENVELYNRIKADK